MEATIDIAFDELVQIAKKLPKKQWTKLKEEVETKDVSNEDKKREDFRNFLLSGPTFTKKQLNEIAKTRKAINQWRTKPL